MFGLFKILLLVLKPLKIITVLFLAVSIISVAQDDTDEGKVLAEVLWVDFYLGEHQLKISEYVDDQWSDETVLYSSKNSLTSPAIGTSKDGTKLIIWTEWVKSKTVLKSISSSSSGIWKEPTIFTDQGFENYAASIVYDPADVAWVFWSSTIDELSDIYFVKSDGFSWSMPERIHKINNVPDIHPQASISELGEIVVSWATYSFESGSYMTETFTFKNGTSVDETKELVDPFTLNDVAVPNFLPQRGLSKMHFPLNVMVQSLSFSSN